MGGIRRCIHTVIPSITLNYYIDEDGIVYNRDNNWAIIGSAKNVNLGDKIFTKNWLLYTAFIGEVPVTSKVYKTCKELHWTKLKLMPLEGWEKALIDGLNRGLKVNELKEVINTKGGYTVRRYIQKLGINIKERFTYELTYTKNGKSKSIEFLTYREAAVFLKCSMENIHYALGKPLSKVMLKRIKASEGIIIKKMKQYKI